MESWTEAYYEALCERRMFTVSFKLFRYSKFPAYVRGLTLIWTNIHPHDYCELG
jgi:hypothetical protein